MWVRAGAGSLRHAVTSGDGLLDRIEIDGEAILITCDLVRGRDRDCERLVWTLVLRPA